MRRFIVFITSISLAMIITCQAENYESVADIATGADTISAVSSSTFEMNDSVAQVQKTKGF